MGNFLAPISAFMSGLLPLTMAFVGDERAEPPRKRVQFPTSGRSHRKKRMVFGRPPSNSSRDLIYGSYANTRADVAKPVKKPVETLKSKPQPMKLQQIQAQGATIGEASSEKALSKEEVRSQELLTQIYVDLHAASIPGVIQATADLIQHLLIEDRQFSTQTWIQSNIALQTRAIFKVVEYAIAGRELNNKRFVADVYAAANSVRLHSDNRLGRADLLAKAEIRLAFRYANFATDHGFMMLSILASSAAFREAARTFDEDTWHSFEEYIRVNFISLEYFAKIRGLDWLTALRRQTRSQHDIRTNLKDRYPEIQPDHPHAFIVPGPKEPLCRPRYKNQDQINIPHNQFSAAEFGQYPPPYGWPPSKPYPSDPTITRARCHICRKTGCGCDPLDRDEVVKPLVEIVNYGIKGNGIRVLQPLKAGDILDEYVGEIRSTSYNDPDDVYTFSFEHGDSPPMAYISSEFVGNWTRFVNHSCDASTHFEMKVVGRRWRAMIIATRDVAIFEELTIDYGSGYWIDGQRLCKCGSDYCKYDTWEKVIRTTSPMNCDF